MKKIIFTLTVSLLTHGASAQAPQASALSGVAAAEYRVAAAEVAVRRSGGSPAAQTALDAARLELLREQLAQREAAKAEARAIAAQRELERQMRMRQADLNRYHQQRAQRVGWLMDWLLPAPR